MKQTQKSRQWGAWMVLAVLSITLGGCGSDDLTPVEAPPTEIIPPSNPGDDPIVPNQGSVTDVQVGSPAIILNKPVSNTGLEVKPTTGATVQSPLQGGHSTSQVQEGESATPVEEGAPAADDANTTSGESDDTSSAAVGNTVPPASSGSTDSSNPTAVSSLGAEGVDLNSQGNTDLGEYVYANATADGTLAKLHVSAPMFKDSFKTSGKFHMALLPTEADGDLIKSVSTVKMKINTPGYVGTVTTTVDQPLIPTPTESTESMSIALDIDSSNCIQTLDQYGDRVAGSLQLIEETLAADPASQVALFDFGHSVGGLGPLVPDWVSDPGFMVTRLLWPWDSSFESLSASLAPIWSTWGSKMGRGLLSTYEVLPLFHQTFPDKDRRVLVVVTDAYTQLEYFNKTFNWIEDLDYYVSLGIPVCPIVVGTENVGLYTDSPYPNQSVVTQNGDLDVPEMMYHLAQKTGCAYFPMLSQDGKTPKLSTLMRGLGEALMSSHPHTYLKITPIPAAGTVVTGTMTVTGSNGGEASASFQFTTPD